MTEGTLRTPSWFFEEEEAADMQYSAEPWTAEFLGTAEWMEDDIERILKGEVLKDFKPASLPTFPTLHRIAAQGILRAKCSLLPVVLLDATSIPEREEAVEMAYGDDTLDSGVRDERGEGWNAEGYDSARRLRMALNPFTERLAQDQEDRRRYRRRRPRFQRCLHLDLSPVHLKPTAPNSFGLFNVHKQYKFSHLPIPTLHHFVSAPLPTPFQPFIISFLRLCPHIPTIHHFLPAPLPTSSSDPRIGPQFDRFKKELHFSEDVENYFFSRLRPGRRTMSPLLPSTVQYSIPAERHQAVHLETCLLPVPGQ